MSTNKDLEVIARIIGENADTIKTPAFAKDLTSLSRAGVLVDLTVKRYRGFTKLRPSDMGIDVSLGERDLLELGSKRLLPQDYIKKMNSIEVTARSVLASSSYRLPWGNFVPANRYPGLKSKLATLRNEYQQMAEDILLRYDEVVVEMLDQYRTQASIAFRRYKYLHPNEIFDETTYVDDYVERISALIPSKDELQSKFAFDVRLYYMPLQNAGANDVAAEFEKALKKRQVQAALAQTEALEQMRQDVLAQAKEEQEALVSTFLRQMMTQLRERTFLLMRDVQASIERNGRLHPASIKSLKSWRQMVKEMDIYGDTELQQMIAQVDEVIAMPADERKDRISDIEEVIRDVAITTSSSLLDLGVRQIQGRRREAIEVPVFSDAAQTLSRKRLGIAEAIPAAPAPMDKRQHRKI
jgi:hypothetical protein